MFSFFHNFINTFKTDVVLLLFMKGRLVVDEKLKNELKSKAALENVKLQDLVERILKRYVEGECNG